MGWIDALRGETVGLDTAPLIYLIERHPVHAPKLKPLFAAAERREFRIWLLIVCKRRDSPRPQIHPGGFRFKRWTLAFSSSHSPSV